MGEPSIVFVSREVYPFESAGLGNYVTFAAAALAPVAEVAILTSSIHERRYHELRAAGDARLPAGVEFHFAPEPQPEEAWGWYGHAHLWSARAFEALSRIYPGGGPTLVEFPDYLGEGFVATQAARTLDPRLRNTLVCVRLYTTAEMCAVLDGLLPTDRITRLLTAIERYALRNAHRVLWPGGGVLDTYRAFYGEHGIADPVRVHHPVTPSSTPAPAPSPDQPLHLLYVGRLERRKGVQNLVRALTAIPGFDWRLTMIGGDTDTGPLGVSMRDQLQLLVDRDPRFEIRGRVERHALRELIESAHVCVSPSLWECWPNTVLESFEQNRPVLATPVGGHLEMVEEGVSGWLARGVEPEHVRRAIERMLGDRGRVEELVTAEGPKRAFDRLTDPDPVREAYLDLAREKTRRAAASRGGATPLISIVVPYYRMHGYVVEALDSIANQTYGRIETIVVNDGSFAAEDVVLEELRARRGVKVVSQINSGLGQARNLGVSLSRGRYVLPFDPDDLLAPTFLERCVATLEEAPEIAYVTAWSTYVNQDGTPHEPEAGYRPIGNETSYVDVENVAGSAMALIRRRVFERGHRFSPDMTSYEDWLFYRELRAAGYLGHVIPERLLLYRVRDDSMLRAIGQRRIGRLLGEVEAHVREQEVRWTPSNA